MAPVQLSTAQARRLALGAQGLHEPRPSGRVDRRHLRRAVDRMGLIQIDSVNVLVRSQELAVFARLGPHPRSLIDDATRDGELFEYWVHEASHAPVELHPLMRWKMNGDHQWKAVTRLQQRRP
ncbi:MAG: DNA glycosylase AlkZ-like family protein, partial [Acidobacteriota bacterium]